ncbi:HTH-type transcriptional activator RhaR [Novipirellula aureliae]|uniref:HTH-type transcriptional activator RhaR n=1 Tax=Novipirellula aureliae TaxID=2527966 RepID=A0A5C6E7Y9_9BACT|nr:helix-turn-helix domain-containing protein [Novipirellula aureliae]TWU43339.1 HTH-type transcriptional activator RhaR [Novipirellula aureliae]
MRILKKEDWFHRDGFPICVTRRDPQRPFGLHAHEFSEIVLVTGGAGQHVTGEDSWPLAVGDVFVIGSGRPHDYLNLDDLSLINVMFDPDSLSLRLHDLHTLPGYHALFHLEPAWRKRHKFDSRLQLSAVEMEQAIRFVDDLDAELESRSPGFRFLAMAAFMSLVGCLSRCYGRQGNAATSSLLDIAETISYLEKNFTQPIQLDYLVRVSGMSRRSFLRAFESVMGCSPISHLIRLRIDQACELLRTTEESVTDIAMQTGFNDSNYFSRQFRRQMNCTPRQYRSRPQP